MKVGIVEKVLQLRSDFFVKVMSRPSRKAKSSSHQAPQHREKTHRAVVLLLSVSCARTR